uniref:Uncharacterized protein n=1 Tax=Strombidium rassoulzadegani TaxID=1082188 RepID=A0A7S3FXX6_9SPIT|mmetsp:Transcript_8586/g.14498  ORF Transcript_8586/g.14498 Transcript_8586/m.14498 type:complete len:115 (+) Transcript_8586:141-485(+)
MLFLTYTSLVALRTNKERKGDARIFHAVVNHLAFAHLPFFILSILVHTLVPKEIPTLLIFFYMMTMIGEALGTIIEKKSIPKLCFFLQTGILFLLFLILMLDDWCRFYLYRGHA